MTKTRMQLLEEYVARTRNEPWEWGRNDCALWVAGAVWAMTEEDLGEEFRGQYATKAEGTALAKSLGYKSHSDVFDQALERCPLTDVQFGDVVLLKGDTLGVVQGRFAWAMSEAGLVLVPMEEARRAWSV